MNLTSEVLQEQLENCTTLYNSLQTSYISCGCEEAPSDPCSSNIIDLPSTSLRIIAIFVVLLGSFLGVALPSIAFHFPTLRIPPFAIVIGKSIGTGIVLACSLVHMLLPAHESLTSSCLPSSFTESYEAYAFLFAMLGVLFMFFMDFLAAEYVLAKQKDRLLSSSLALNPPKTAPLPDDDPHSHSHPGHVHGGLLLDDHLHHTLAAYFLEFGVTVHSIFIGLAVGVSDASTLRLLLVALVFHQFFEGLALGSRLVDAKLRSPWQEVFLGFLFSVSAPLGIAIGIGITHTLNPNGPSFLFVQGIFDAVCAGFLMYIAFLLMMRDFPEDVHKFAVGKHATLRKGILMFSVWFGGCMMAFLGKYL